MLVALLAVTPTSILEAGLALRPAYRDGFRGGGGMFVFVRNAAGQVTEMRYTTGRVRNLRFARR